MYDDIYIYVCVYCYDHYCCYFCYFTIIIMVVIIIIIIFQCIYIYILLYHIYIYNYIIYIHIYHYIYILYYIYWVHVQLETKALGLYFLFIFKSPDVSDPALFAPTCLISSVSALPNPSWKMTIFGTPKTNRSTNVRVSRGVFQHKGEKIGLQFGIAVLIEFRSVKEENGYGIV